MITLALFEQMAADGVAGLVKNENFFWEEISMQHDGSPAEGVWLITRGGSAQDGHKGCNLRTMVDFYVGFSDKTKTEMVHQEILQYMLSHMCFCTLSGTKGSATYSYSNVRIRPQQTPQNMGATENGNIIKTASAEIIYDINL